MHNAARTTFITIILLVIFFIIAARVSGVLARTGAMPADTAQTFSEHLWIMINIWNISHHVVYINKMWPRGLFFRNYIALGLEFLYFICYQYYFHISDIIPVTLSQEFDHPHCDVSHHQLYIKPWFKKMSPLEQLCARACTLIFQTFNLHSHISYFLYLPIFLLHFHSWYSYFLWLSYFQFAFHL